MSNNKYLEKIAAWAGIAKGFAGAGKLFQSVDSAYGAGVRTIQKAMKPTTPSRFAIRGAIRKDRGALVNGPMNKAEARKATSAITSGFRTENNLVKKAPTTITIAEPGGTSTRYANSGYESNTATGNNSILKHINNKIKGVGADADRIRAARAKLAIGGAGLAGAGALGYHAANRSNDPGFNQQQFYMP